MRSTHSLTVISLGGGVQSSVMSFMASGGAFGAIPDCAIFADTHWEPPTSTPTWTGCPGLSFPLYVVDNGRSLREDAKALTNHSGNRELPPHTQGNGLKRRRHGTTAVHRALQGATDPPEDTRAARAEEETEDTLRRHHRAVAGHLDRRGDPDANVPRQVDT